MSKIESLFSFIEKLRTVRVPKQFRILFYFVLVTFFTLNMGNAFAEEKPPLDIPNTYKVVKDTFTGANQTPQSNVGSSTPSQIVALIATPVCIGSSKSCMTEATMNSLNLDENSRLGVFGVIEKANRMAIYSPPVVDIPQHLAEEWIPGKKVENYSTFAASGYEYLSSLHISDLWDKVRNICYVFFVLVLIIAGFMIMFRQKIGGQVAITVYNTIPNVIIGLVLVTFSFAIVGIILDLSAMAMRLIAGIFNYSDPGKYVYLGDPFQLITGGLKASTSVAVLGENSLSEAAFNAANASSSALAGLNGVISWALGAIIGLIIAAIVIILFIYAAIKVFVTVFKAYLGIIFDTILSPIYLTLSVVPGKESVRKDWFNRVIKNAAVFPVVFFLVNLPDFFRTNQIILDMQGIGNGTLTPTTGATGFTEVLISGLLPLFMYFAAAEVPKYLSDFFPSNTPKGAAEAMAAMKKMPLVGGFF